MEKQRRQVDIDAAKEKMLYDNTGKFSRIQGRGYHVKKLEVASEMTSKYNIIKFIAGIIVLIAIVVFILIIIK